MPGSRPWSLVTALVVGHSRAAASQEALRVSRDMARRLGARLVVVHAVTLDDYPADPDGADWDEHGRCRLDQQRRQVGGALAGSRADWSYRVARGDPAGLIASVAEEVEALMIIVGDGSRGLGAAVGRMFGGSVPHRLVRCQARPVLVVPAPRPAASAHGTAPRRERAPDRSPWRRRRAGTAVGRAGAARG